MKRYTLFSFLLYLSILPHALDARTGDGRFQQPEAAPPESEGAEKDGESEKDATPKTIEELVEESDLMEGLFSVYRDRKTGEVRIELAKEQLDRTYLYFSYTESGPAPAGQFRGNFNTFDAKAFKIRRFFDRVEFVVENTNYYFDSDKAISRSAGANVSHAVIFDQKIDAEDEERGVALVKIDSLFLKDVFHPVTYLPDPDAKPHERFSLGALSASKSKIREIRNYPNNVDVIVEYVFENEKPYVGGGNSITDPRNVSMIVQHSLIEAPADPIEPRFDDARVGYFTSQVNDLSSTEVAPYRDPIHRWRLEKENPEAPMSKPVKPIVFWLENTTPLALRPAIEAAALRWNEAFEQAGFENAIVVKQQPDDAEWDAGDIRYNVIRWASSPEPQFGGYGPSFADPRTGEIIGADIVLEHVVIGSNTLSWDAHGSGALARDHPQKFCAVQAHALQAMQFGTIALETAGAGIEEKERLLEEFIYFLTLHEIGHTLGLNHNFRSSYLHSFEELFDPEITYDVGLLGSVMDYPDVPFGLEGDTNGQFWTTRPGPYDKWAIEFGYSRALGDEDGESERIADILARSTRPELAFANDADDMRSPGKAIDPRAMVGDMSSDPIAYAAHKLELIDRVLPALKDKLLEEGDTYQYLNNGYRLSIRRARGAYATLSRHIGGVYVDRSVVGQEGGGEPFTPVPLEEQTRAMGLLREKLFAPDAFDAYDDIARYLLNQRRGFEHYESTEDPKLHALALSLQSDVLDHLLHPRVLARLTDTRLYGNMYSVNRFLNELSDAIFADDIGKNANTIRQNLQLEYVNRLLTIVTGDGYDAVTQSKALDRLRWIESTVRRTAKVDEQTLAHRNHLRYRIERGLDRS